MVDFYGKCWRIYGIFSIFTDSFSIKIQLNVGIDIPIHGSYRFSVSKNLFLQNKKKLVELFTYVTPTFFGGGEIYGKCGAENMITDWDVHGT